MYQNNIEPDWTRLIAVLIAQLMLCIIYLSISFAILKRNRNQLNKMLSAFYITEAAGFLLNAVYFFIRTNPLTYILFLITAFLVIYGFIFLVLFLITLINISFSKNMMVAVLIFYAVSIIWCFFGIPGGIRIDESTNWRPVISWYFLIGIYIFYSGFVVIPTIIYSRKTYKMFEDTELKRRLKYFFIGVISIIILGYGSVLYSTWDEPLFRIAWGIFSLFIIPSGILIYYGIVHKL